MRSHLGRHLYMPNLGRWLNRDPLQEQGGINLYAYVDGDPLGYVDPDGRFAVAMLHPAVAIPVSYVVCRALGGCEIPNLPDWPSWQNSNEEDEEGPKRARNKKRKGQGPCEIDRIDPPHGQPGSQWHAHGTKGGALNQDGEPKDSDPKFSNKTKKWLKKHGWKI
ncbi:RHS repeat-associated core domain-containing protein [Vibrio splendidus]|uniref:RHS repeat-associated core domain-containing protein n=1 Tax=Vibrio splendidus TaxID=29497 RepID=UPI0021594844|nr:RHS repeat-associated core domain-containing protein [Vibrio splendidus]